MPLLFTDGLHANRVSLREPALLCIVMAIDRVIQPATCTSIVRSESTVCRATGFSIPMTRTIRQRSKFYGAPKKETLNGGRYALIYQAIDDRKHPDEVKAQGDAFPILVEVFDGEELTYQAIFGVRDDRERYELLEGFRREVAGGIYASQHAKINHNR